MLNEQTEERIKEIETESTLSQVTGGASDGTHVGAGVGAMVGGISGFMGGVKYWDSKPANSGGSLIALPVGAGAGVVAGAGIGAAVPKVAKVVVRAVKGPPRVQPVAETALR